MRDRFPLLVVGGLVFVAVFGFFLVRVARRGDFADRLSTFKSDKDGSRALYLLLEEAQLPVERLQRDLTIIPEGKTLVLLGTRFAAEDLARAGGDGGVDADQAADDEEFEQRGLNAIRSPPISADEVEKLLAHVSSGATAVIVPSSARDPEVLEDLDVYLERADRSLDVRTLVPAQPSRYLSGVQRVVTPVRAWLDLPSGAVPLLVDDTLDKPVVGLITHGQGRIIVISAPDLATNARLSVADNAQLWVSLLSAARGPAGIGFDEFHHGFTGDRSLGEFAARYGLQWAVLQLLFGVSLWALALKRFGRAKAPPEDARVGSTDALFATSRLYREGQHRRHASLSLMQAVAFELAARAGVSGRSEPALISAALDERGRSDLANALRELASAAARSTSEADVERVAGLAATLRKKLTHHQRTTR